MRHCTFVGKQFQLKHSLVLDLDTPYKEKYDPKFRSKTNVHRGQRKLLISEVQLLTEYYKKSKEHPVVIYVGAAPGIKNIILTRMFPYVKFVLFDGAKFNERLKEPKYKKVFEIHEGDDGFFTTEKCKQLVERKAFGDRPIIFISDIRLGENDFEGGVARDMALQKEWVQILKPELSLLKFRLPYTMKHGETLKYMKGTLFYGIWAKPNSGETRLLVRKRDIKKEIEYDFKKYEEALVFHNKYTRSFCFSKEVKAEYKKYVDDGNYCACYDCIAEMKVIENYLKSDGIPFKRFDSIVEMLGPLPWPTTNSRSVNLDSKLGASHLHSVAGKADKVGTNSKSSSSASRR